MSTTPRTLPIPWPRPSARARLLEQAIVGPAGDAPFISIRLPPIGYHYYASLSEPDLDALVAYLRTLPPQQDE